ncbi:gamma-butyrobetaine hydroxylase-like domain-containing protein [Amphibiibacter pelophylacis]|uniref:DUF971 domain-containing protein n=1 Tax=Amphibiibacter pelophylacis TaxID=1799477 RepID=A0ACC6P0N8_9BURK
MSAPTLAVLALTVHQRSRELEVQFQQGDQPPEAPYRIPFELLRVRSPSAEVQGHGPGQETVQTGKADVGISAIQPVGNYGIKPLFTDGHDSGIYTWPYLYDLATRQGTHWQAYDALLAREGLQRDGRSAQP